MGLVQICNPNDNVKCYKSMHQTFSNNSKWKRDQRVKF